jgi:hypothetical protein
MPSAGFETGFLFKTLVGRDCWIVGLLDCWIVGIVGLLGLLGLLGWAENQLIIQICFQ